MSELPPAVVKRLTKELIELQVSALRGGMQQVDCTLMSPCSDTSENASALETHALRC